MELIVVIAIMAVLAGVVSGATVGILKSTTYTTENKFLHKSFRGRRKSLNALRSSPNLRGSKST